MSNHLTRTLLRPLVFLSAIAFVSCEGDDPALVAKREQQRAEIRSLEGELAVLQERLKDAPRDRSDELEELQKQTQEEKGKIVVLEEVIASLESEKKKLEAELKTYQRDYPLR